MRVICYLSGTAEVLDVKVSGIRDFPAVAGHRLVAGPPWAGLGYLGMDL